MVKSGQDLMRISGEARWILLAERTALNIIGRMSGIATTTRKLVETVNQVNQSCRVAATRKTAPGMRLLDKKAVIIGGGDPHRLGLSDGFLVKDNHLALISIEEAISRLLKRSVTKKIEIEVADRESALRAISAGADIVMFDNMNAEEVRSAIRFLEERGLRKEVIIEVSGGITGSNIAAYASCGVDLISVGGLTHSVRNLDVSLEIIPGLV
jgi:nicotinate-nucleotide pyrophosphorylase (carboxylating)